MNILKRNVTHITFNSWTFLVFFLSKQLFFLHVPVLEHLVYIHYVAKFGNLSLKTKIQNWQPGGMYWNHFMDKKVRERTWILHKISTFFNVDYRAVLI